MSKPPVWILRPKDRFYGLVWGIEDEIAEDGIGGEPKGAGDGKTGVGGAFRGG